MPLNEVDIDKLELEIIGLRKDRKQWKRKGDSTMKTFKDSMAEKYNYLATKSSGLFEMSIKGVLEDPAQEAKMYHMLGLMRSAQSGSRSLASAEKQFGQENFNEFVKPIVDRLDDDHPATCNLMDQAAESGASVVSSTSVKGANKNKKK